MTHMQHCLEEDFPEMNQRGAAKGNAVFLFQKKEKKGAHQSPACTPTHNLLLHDAPVAAFLFLEEITQHTDMLWGTAPLCGNYGQDKLTLGTYKVYNHLFILWQIV